MYVHVIDIWAAFQIYAVKVFFFSVFSDYWKQHKLRNPDPIMKVFCSWPLCDEVNACGILPLYLNVQ